MFGAVAVVFRWCSGVAVVMFSSGVGGVAVYRAMSCCIESLNQIDSNRLSSPHGSASSGFVCSQTAAGFGHAGSWYQGIFRLKPFINRKH